MYISFLFFKRSFIFLFSFFAPLLSEGFAPDTLVSTPYGHVRIDSLKPGDYVLSENERGETVPNRILAIRKQKVSCYANLSFEQPWWKRNINLKTACNQKFFECSYSQWQESAELYDYAQIAAKDKQKISVKEKNYIHLKKQEEFIDLAFAEHHNFYVTEKILSLITLHSLLS